MARGTWHVARRTLRIGATSAIFSVVNGVMLRPLPYLEPETLVRVIEIVPEYGRFSVAPANFFDWMLFGVTPFDPASYAVTVAVLLSVSVLACYVPARRAMRVDPLVALRQE